MSDGLTDRRRLDETADQAARRVRLEDHVRLVRAFMAGATWQPLGSGPHGFLCFRDGKWSLKCDENGVPYLHDLVRKAIDHDV